MRITKELLSDVDYFEYINSRGGMVRSFYSEIILYTKPKSFLKFFSRREKIKFKYPFQRTQSKYCTHQFIMVEPSDEFYDDLLVLEEHFLLDVT